MWKNWAILLLTWTDDVSEPFAPSYAEQMFTGAGRGTGNMVDFYDAISHGRADLSASQVFGWFSVNHSLEDYANHVQQFAVEDGTNNTTLALSKQRALIQTWGLDAAAANNLDLSAFDGVVLVFNRKVDYFGINRRAVLGYDAANPTYNSVDLTGASHELGHAYNLEHSRRDGSADEYGDLWDLMSAYTAYYANQKMVPATTRRPYHTFGPGLNAVNMAIMDWLDETRVYSPPGTSPTIVLRPLHRRDLPGFLAIRVENLYVEFRMNDRWDAAFPTPVVLLHRRGVHPHTGMDCSYLTPGKSANGSEVQTLGVGDSWENGPERAQRLYVKLMVLRIDPFKQEAEVEITYRLPLEAPDAVRGILLGGVEVGAGGYFWIPGKERKPIPPHSPLLAILEALATVHEVQDSGVSRPDALAAGDALLVQARDALDRLITARREARVPGPDLEGVVTQPRRT
jgi:hypothetical protein